MKNNLLNAMEKGIWTLRTERWGGGRKTMIIHHNRIVFILELHQKQYVLKTCWDLDSFKRPDEINRYLMSVSQTARLSKIDLRSYLSKQNVLKRKAQWNKPREMWAAKHKQVVEEPEAEDVEDPMGVKVVD
eukprot:766109_1